MCAHMVACGKGDYVGKCGYVYLHLSLHVFVCCLPACVLVLHLCWQNTRTGLSAKKYRELDARMKATEDELQVKKKEVKQLETALQFKSDALTSLDGLGERSKGECPVALVLPSLSCILELSALR